MALLKMVEPPDRVEGSVSFLGRDVLGMRGRETADYRWNGVAIVFQAAMNSLDPVVTIGKNFSELLRDKKLASGKTEAESTAKRLLTSVGLPESVYSMFPFELSGGMKQRVLIAMALSAKPKLLIADEPTTALDTLTQFAILNLIKSLRDSGAIESVLLISHDISVQLFMVDRMMVLLKGRLVEIGTREQIVKNPLHPYTKVLIETSKGGLNPVPRHKGLEAAPGACPFANSCPYVMDRCTREMPRPVTKEGGHSVACFLFGGS
jgi:peptide/nickel transport system ATP-binding protein